MRFFDSHAHYNDERFANEFDGGAEAALKASFEAGVIGIVNCGTNCASSRESLALADKYQQIFAAVGVHPEDVDRESLASLDVIKQLAAHDKAVAIGEIGLDYHWRDDNRDIQREFFDRQLSLAEELDLPVVIHDRDAHGDVFDIIRTHKSVRGVMHSYSGSLETARQLLNGDWSFSFSGPLTYKNSVRAREVAAYLPDDRILIETDAPYLPPTPYRGKLNYSAYAAETLKALADCRGIGAEEAAELTLANTLRVFGITL